MPRIESHNKEDIWNLSRDTNSKSIADKKFMFITDRSMLSLYVDHRV